jgi:dTDP-4-dehydrorhamnose 3,5-epimerase
MIDGIRLIPLVSHCDDRGRVMEILRRDDPHFKAFGQAYISTIYPGVIKAWHAHTLQTDALSVIRGMVLVGMFDDRKGSPTKGKAQHVVAGTHRPLLIVIPPGIFHGFRTLGAEEAMLLNLPSEPYNREEPDELRRPWDDPDIPFDWETEFR